jgi:[NiFe] hydrogenase assembly HybE family chaperone
MRGKTPTETLEHHFREIQRTRMADVPILNPALSVQGVGFEHNEHGWVGVLITPWLISLFLLPDNDDQPDLPAGSIQAHSFPSGRCDFIVAHDEDLGCYQSCSLLSPVLELADQRAAVGLAEAALQALYEPCESSGSSRDQTPRPENGAVSRRAFLFGRGTEGVR